MAFRYSENDSEDSSSFDGILTISGSQSDLSHFTVDFQKTAWYNPDFYSKITEK